MKKIKRNDKKPPPQQQWLLFAKIPKDLLARAILDPFLNRHEKRNLFETVPEFLDYTGATHFCSEHGSLLGGGGVLVDGATSEAGGAPPPQKSVAAAAGTDTPTPPASCEDCHMHQTKREARCEVCRDFYTERNVQACRACKTQVCRACKSDKVVLHPLQAAVSREEEGPRLCTNCDECAVCPPSRAAAAAGAVKKVICCTGPFCKQVFCLSQHSPKMVRSCDMAMFCFPIATCETCTDQFDQDGAVKCISCPMRMCSYCSPGNKKQRKKRKTGTTCPRCEMGGGAFASFMGPGRGGGGFGGLFG
jgi:hypothetical protein